MNIYDFFRQWNQNGKTHHRAVLYLTVEYDDTTAADIHFDTIGSTPTLLAALEETLIHNDGLRLFFTIALRRAQTRLNKAKDDQQDK